MKQRSVLALALLLFAACGGGHDPAKMSAQLLDADREFSNASLQAGIDKAFLRYAHDEATLLRPAHMPIVGRAEIEKFLSNDPTGAAYTLSWTPMKADVAASGEIGYTFGLNELRSKADGSVVKGTYASVWKRDEKGLWKWVLYTGNLGLD